MKIPPFGLERYFASREFQARHLLAASDCQSATLCELLDHASSDLRRRWDALALSYTESQGLHELRAEVASLYQGLGPDQILLLVPEEGIFLLTQHLLSPGDHVVCPFPAYESLYGVARSIGCQVSFWAPREDEGWRFHPDDLERLVRPETRLVVTNFPHNPTGYLPPEEDFRKIVDVARSAGAYLFSDEMYRLLEYHPADRLPSAVELYDRAVVLFGMSKTFGMPGVRLGWLASRDRDLMTGVAALKDYTTICGAAPSELLSLMALRDRERMIAGQLRRIRRNLGLLASFMERQAAVFSWVPPRAGTVCFPRLRAGGAEAFCERLLREASVMLLPSSVYGHGDSHVRFGLGREDFPQGLADLEAWLSAGSGSQETPG